MCGTIKIAAFARPDNPPMTCAIAGKPPADAPATMMRVLSSITKQIPNLK
ncbi:MAG TPA: hypothetical protein VIM16_07180 [Mucilaginibacter sp.]|jgi:hypothetical protein